MRLEHLSAFNFRNLDKLEITIDARVVVLRGQNGQGKTNLLEALYVCCTGRSFRLASPREMTAWDQPKGWARARFSRQGVRHDVEALLQPPRRVMTVDSKRIRHASRLLELVNVVAFFPDDLRIIKGSPEKRRRFLDRAVANYEPRFVDAALAYAKVLRSRNALLRSDKAPDRSLLAVYDGQLVEYGVVMNDCRVAGLAALEPSARKTFEGMMGGTGELGLKLESGVPTQENESFFDGFTRSLIERYPRDRARRLTTCGPHRADVEVSMDGRSARSFASQGQQRAMVLALKLAEVSSLAQELGLSPILLLDDVSSELDEERTRVLFDFLGSMPSQLWITTTGTTALPLPTDSQLFEVKKGALLPVEEGRSG